MSETIKTILNNCKHIAVVGLSPDTSKASHRVSAFMQDKGYEIYPIYPKECEILGRKAVLNLKDLRAKVDLVLMFRKGEFASELLPIIKEKGIKNFWLQLGITNNEVKTECEKLGIAFVQDKCIKIEYQNLFGS